MPVKLTNVSGNGSIEANSIFDYNYSEEATSLEPSTISGATSQVTISAISVNSEETLPHLDSKLLINNQMILTDDALGSVEFGVKSLSKNINNILITGDTIQSRLNVERIAEPQGGAGANLLSAITYYCDLVGITPSIDSEFSEELSSVPVNFIGWSGVLWDKLKELCAGFSASATNNVGIEMIIINNELIFRKAKQSLINIDKKLVDDSINIESFESSKSVTVYNYNTRYGEKEVFYDVSNFDSSRPISERFQSSITDSMQVEPGQTLRKRFNVNLTPETVEQPVCVEQIDRSFPSPYSGETGQYVIVGIDDLPIKPQQWIDNGGSVTVELHDENNNPLPPGQIDLVIKAPPLTGLAKAVGENEIAFAPYKIGVESSGEADYPALWLTGTGVFFEKKAKMFLTGSSDLYTSSSEGPTVDNIFITDAFNVTSRGVAAAQANCGPIITISRQVAEGVSFGDVGSLFVSGLNKYRINTTTFNSMSISTTSIASFDFAEWNEIWDGKTFDEFNDRILNADLFPDEALKFNEFTVIPRIGPE
jgi:hypothetical protein